MVTHLLCRSSLASYLLFPCCFAIVMAEDYLYRRFRLLRLALYGLFPILFESWYFHNPKRSSVRHMCHNLFHTLDLIAFFAKLARRYYHQKRRQRPSSYRLLP